MPTAEMTHEARRQFLSLPAEVADRFKELADHLKTSPLRLAPWFDVKATGRERGSEVFRARVGEYRATYVFDGEIVRFTRFRLRKDIGYAALPKS